MRVELLYFDDCPNHEDTAVLIDEVARELGVEVDLDKVKVDSPEAAERTRFLGSPTVRVNGNDIDPAARDRRDYGLACRRYGEVGVPPREMIAAAMRGNNGNGDGNEH